jgi:hypothetical protein
MMNVTLYRHHHDYQTTIDQPLTVANAHGVGGESIDVFAMQEVGLQFLF